MRDALVRDELLIDCIAHELPLIEAGTRQGRLLTPFFTDPACGVRFAFGYWRPGQTPFPHEHSAWTISAVCHNVLNVSTYDRAESYRRREPVPKNLFVAATRETGFIYEPALHAPWNPSNDWSLSLHIISPRDGQPVNDFEPLPGISVGTRAREQAVLGRHPYTRVLRARATRQEADVLALVLHSLDTPRTRELLARVAPLASSGMRAALRDRLPEPTSAPRMLARIHPGVRFVVQREVDDWTVMVETPAGPTSVLSINDAAHDAYAFACAQTTFDTRDLPGNLTDDERTAIADSLEDVGLFKGMAA